LKRKPPGQSIDAAQQDLQHVHHAAGLEAVGMGGDAAHGVHGDGPADHLVVLAPFSRSRAVEDDLLLEGDMRDLGGDAADLLGRNAGRSATASGA
jgi:hypothetical protein